MLESVSVLFCGSRMSVFLWRKQGCKYLAYLGRERTCGEALFATRFWTEPDSFQIGTGCLCLCSPVPQPNIETIINRSTVRLTLLSIQVGLLFPGHLQIHEFSNVPLPDNGHTNFCLGALLQYANARQTSDGVRCRCTSSLRISVRLARASSLFLG